MSKKVSKKTAKNSVSKKKTNTVKPSKSAVKKSKAVKKIIAKKPVAKKVKPKAIKKAVVKKKAVAKKKASKPAPKKIVVKKAIKPAAPAKALVVKKQKEAKPVKQAKASKVAVTKSVSQKNLKPIFQPVRKNHAVDLRVEKHVPDPPGKYELEYIIHTSTPILFEFLTTPSGLSEWFCDDVNIRDGIYSFKWDENSQNAELIKYIEESVARFQWTDRKDNSYFEFRIERDDLTNDISLIVADFADTPEDRHSSTLLWNSQIDKLLHVLGSY